MNSASMSAMIELARAGDDSKPASFATICKRAIEVGIIVPSILKRGLTDAGYRCDFMPKPQGVEVSIKHRLDKLLAANHPGAVDFHACETRDPNATPPADDTMLEVARAFSFDETDAILQAIYAELREGR